MTAQIITGGSCLIKAVQINDFSMFWQFQEIQESFQVKQNASFNPLTLSYIFCCLFKHSLSICLCNEKTDWKTFPTQNNDSISWNHLKSENIHISLLSLKIPVWSLGLTSCFPYVKNKQSWSKFITLSLSAELLSLSKAQICPFPGGVCEAGQWVRLGWAVAPATRSPMETFTRQRDNEK